MTRIFDNIDTKLGDHLQAMFHLAQIAIGGDQFIGDQAAAFADRDQAFDGGAGRAHTLQRPPGHRPRL